MNEVTSNEYYTHLEKEAVLLFQELTQKIELQKDLDNLAVKLENINWDISKQGFPKEVAQHIVTQINKAIDSTTVEHEIAEGISLKTVSYLEEITTFIVAEVKEIEANFEGDAKQLLEEIEPCDLLSDRISDRLGEWEEANE